MRILFACRVKTDFDAASDALGALGGIEAANLELARELARRGHSVALATPSSTGGEYQGVVSLPLAEIAQHAADIVIASNDATLFDAAPGAARKIFWQHNPLSFERAFKKGQIGPLKRHRPLLVNGGPYADTATSSRLSFSGRTFAPLGLASVFIDAPAPTAPRTDRFVWVSQKQRGLAPTLEAWSRLVAPQAPEATLHVFGVEPGELAGAPGVIAHPRAGKAQIAAFHAASRALFCPGAADETFCLAAAEALAMGLPVLTLGVGALSERVQHGVNGLIARDPGGLAQAALDLVRSPALFAQLSAGAFATGRLYSWARAAQIWEDRILPAKA